MRSKRFFSENKILKKPETYLEWRKYGEEFLEEKMIRDAGTDAGLLMEFVSGMDRNRWFMERGGIMPAGEAERYEKLLRKRADHVPLQHLMGGAWFYGRFFKVNEHVLVPRMDTEVLVEEALRYLKQDMKVLDMCTGSGCILLTVMKESGCRGTGCDISPEALKTAGENAEALGLEPVFIRGDLFENISGKFDVILSNPPYIRTSVIGTLDKEVREHEPVIALDGGGDGLYFYRRIIEQAGSYLNKNGRIFFETGYDQGRQVKDMLLEAGFQDLSIIKDLAGLDRVVHGQAV